MFRPPPDKQRIQADSATIGRLYRYWRLRQLATTFVGYAVYYFVRKNFSVAMPLIGKALGITKTSLGGFLTAHGLLYGSSKFVNGFLADRSNARTFMSFGLFVSALINLTVGFTEAALVMGLLWCLNGWFQGMGFPPCARVLSHWFSPGERGVMWGIWNCSHMVGAAVILVLAGALGDHFGWKWCFWGPALIAMATAGLTLLVLRDTPASVGLAPVEAYTGEPPETLGTEALDGAAFRQLLRRRVFTNPQIWFVCAANFFVYVVRYGFLDWAPTYLHEVKKLPLTAAGLEVAGFEVAGLLGALSAGLITDRLTGGRRAPTCVVYMLGAALAVYAFWRSPAEGGTLTLLTVGFLIYGPQFLVGVITAGIATKQAAATAIGLTGFFGYLSGVVSGWGLGFVVESHGWDGGFVLLIVCALLAALFFALCWKAGDHEH